MCVGSVNEFLDVGFGLEEIVDPLLPGLIPCTADVLDDVALKEAEVLIDNKIPDLNLS